MSRVESNIHTLGDLSGKRVAILNGTSTEQVLEAALKKDDVKAEIVNVGSNREGLRNVSDRSADAFVSDRTILLSLAKSSSEPDGYRVVERLLSYEPYALMLRRDSAFRIAINRQLSRLYRSDAIHEIYGKWFGDFGPPSEEQKTLYRVFGSVQ